MPILERHPGLKVDLDVTPAWWNSHFGPRSFTYKNEGAALAIARAMMLAAEEFDSFLVEVVTKRNSLSVIVYIPVDVTLGRLCEKAGSVVERANALVPESDWFVRG